MYKFNLKFDNVNTLDYQCAVEKEILRVLNNIVSETGKTVDVLLDIMSTRFYKGDAHANAVIKHMLTLLTNVVYRDVLYCFDCDTLTPMVESTDIHVCNSAGTNRQFRISITELAPVAMEDLCRLACVNLEQEISALREGLVCSREFINKIVDIACSTNEHSIGADCHTNHACGAKPDEHCSCIRL